VGTAAQGVLGGARSTANGLASKLEAGGAGLRAKASGLLGK
jgi:hypothetical protein